MILLISLLCEFKAVKLPRISQEINLSLLQPVNFISKSRETTLSLVVIIPNKSRKAIGKSGGLA
ncbi:TPA: hypothetical protein ACIR5G_000596 [Proteus mirabilis]|uniref:hypothetical protein n=1 Tax=Proteus mirabilis TaxID=584 RepID=UPI0013D65624|nr:hypothetical protein [Proteus mirabilis]MBG2848031.1 hypothetical protein [Proteus mirabilis]MBG3122615.1 hypothetical protein [Proteus mirabilis]MBI6292874.1 hypothetical protein [Proteus mirabilis]MBI6323932.1 hypothetical protein [Proteus mirabilis]MBI6398239.1 hypothetical protein [Proteus mirabilis]